MVTSSLGSSFSRAQEEVKEALPPSLSHLDPKLSPTVNGLSLYLKRHHVISISSSKLLQWSQAWALSHFGGPEVKPGSSNMSSFEREDDLAPMGVSCSISCISDITEWDTELEREAQTKTVTMVTFADLENQLPNF